jgi:LacI family transcriptional regulator
VPVVEQGSHGRIKRPTLTAVAQAAGVSTATASKVLNDRPDVAPETRRRVTDAINDLGYESTTAPRAIHVDPVVTVVFDSLVNSYSIQVLRGVLTAAREMDVDIVVEVLNERAGGATSGDRPLSVSWVRAVAQKGWRGVLAVTTEITPELSRAFREAGVDLVAIDPPNALDDSLVSVGSTNFIGGTQATNHLIGLGHRRIGVAAGPSRSPVARERVHGYRSALEAADLQYDDRLILYGEFEYPAGVEMAVALLSRDDPPTAILAGCDASAFGVLEGARRLGVRVPNDLSVVGYDDTPAAVTSAPPLTTVRQPMNAMGRVALRNLLQQNTGEEPASHHIQLATTLIVRESTAAPPAQGKRVQPA